MQTTPKATAPAASGFFNRIFGGLRNRIRRIFGKRKEGPNIYPYF